MIFGNNCYEVHRQLSSKVPRAFEFFDDRLIGHFCFLSKGGFVRYLQVIVIACVCSIFYGAHR